MNELFNGHVFFFVACCCITVGEILTLYGFRWEKKSYVVYQLFYRLFFIWSLFYSIIWGIAFFLLSIILGTILPKRMGVSRIKTPGHSLLKLDSFTAIILLWILMGGVCFPTYLSQTYLGGVVFKIFF